MAMNPKVRLVLEDECTQVRRERRRQRIPLVDWLNGIGMRSVMGHDHGRTGKRLCQLPLDEGQILLMQGGRATGAKRHVHAVNHNPDQLMIV